MRHNMSDRGPSRAFLIALLALALLLGSLPAQCLRGTHPAGISSVPGTTIGCQEIDGTGMLTWASMLVAPSERGGPMTFTYLDPPSAGPRPAFALGVLVLSPAVAVPGVRVPRTLGAGCTFHVPLDVVIQVLVPLRPGCQAVQALFLPPLPGLAGFSLYAQTWAQDLTVARSLVTNPIRLTFQP